MSVYEYNALDAKGRNRKGMIPADNAKKARQYLRDQGLFPVSVLTQSVISNTQKGAQSRLKLNDTELSIITRQFAILLSSGLTIEDCFTALVNQEESYQIESMLSNIKEKVLEGHTLAYAFSGYPRTFSELYIATIEAGEQTGKLSEVMERLAQYIEDRLDIGRKITSALVYPIILMVVSILIVSGLITFVVPKVVSVFSDTGQALPWLTRILIGVSDFVKQHGFTMMGVITICSLGTISVFRKGPPKLWLHGVYLRLPGIKKLSQGLNAARMARTLSIMVGSDVPLITALEAGAKVVANQRMRHSLRQATNEVTEGASLHKALERAGHFPPLMVQMVQSGEKSGRLAEMLEKSAAVAERQIESRTMITVSLFEPLMILIMGALVMLIVLAILLPIFDINQIIS
ncbi:MAG: type II secretion system protein GspF [Gammaproteobacteria bacterium]|nr:type II secretion system protein GspF [Gammaproteobacteria bacterium]